MRKIRTIAVSAIFMTAVAAAASPSGSFRIELSNGSHVTSLDAPVQRGTVVTFHNASGGALTGVPAEMVVRIVKDGKDRPGGRGAAAVSRNRPLVGTRGAGTRGDDLTVRPRTEALEPGEVLVLGPMGDGMSAPMMGAASGTAGTNAGANAQSTGAGVGGYGGALNPNVINPNTAINPNQTLVGTDGLARVPSSTDLLRAQEAQGAVGPNGFPATSNGAPTVIGPNGTPTLAPGFPGSGTQVIGPNGTPVVPGSPTTAQPVIGPNGTPVLAQPGQPGSVQPGQPGSAQPVIGPNGTPVTAPTGQPGGPAANPGTGQNPGSAPSSGTAPGASPGSSGGASPGGPS